MDIKEFLHLKEIISIGEEIALSYKGEEYWISHTKDGKSLLTRSRDSYSQVFDSVEKLFENGKIEGQYLKHIYPGID